MPLKLPRNGQFTISDLLSVVAGRIARIGSKSPIATGALTTTDNEVLMHCTKAEAIAYFRAHGEEAREVAWIPDHPSVEPLLYEDVATP